LCDEILAVGDESFQKKCIKVFEGWKKSGKTIILVSHNSQQIEDLCTRAILLEKGKLTMDGHPKKIVAKYHEGFAL